MSVRRTARCRADDGLAMILVALTLVVLMIFAAFAVDLGALYNLRRQDQSAADSASLGAAQELRDLTDTDIVSQVKTLAHSSLGYTFTNTEWNSCAAFAAPNTSADPDPVDTPVTGSNCITVDGTAGSRRRIQVRLPSKVYDTSFGRVVGLDDFDHTAFAIAGLQRIGFGSILPFAFPVGGGNGLNCLKDPSSGHGDEVCPGSTAGNFRYVDLTFFGSDEVGTTERCSGFENLRLANNTAAGVDHDMEKRPGDPRGDVLDRDECNAAEGSERPPNGMSTTTGNRVAALGDGMYSGTGFSDGADARLRRSDPLLFGGTGAMTTTGHPLDDNPLWQFITTGLDSNHDGSGNADVPASCEKQIFLDVLGGTYTGLPTTPGPNVRGLISGLAGNASRMRYMLDRCFTHYDGKAWTAFGAIGGGGEPTTCPVTGCTGAVFGRNSNVEEPDLPDIQYTPRFGYVPQLTGGFPSGASDPVFIQTFRAVFIQRVLGDCGGTCDVDFEPGVGRSIPSSESNAEAVTVFVFPKTMLPNGLSGDDAPFKLGVNRFVRLIR
jgi:Flp pilus assembly protein TadG